MEYSKGKILEGKIIHVAEDYLLVKFPNKETGILHKSKMSPQPESDLTDLYRRNQSILVSIDGITEKGYTLGQKDIENRYENQLRHEAKELEKQKKAEERERMKELVENCASQFIRGGVYEAEVIRLSNQIAKISIDGIDGYIKKDELNWNENDSVKESLFEGEIIHAVFLEYTDGKLLFGLKYLEEKPYDDDLYSLSTEELLKRLGHNNNVFIAEAKNIKGICLTNLYSEEGNLLIDPFKGNNIVVRFIQPTIEEGKFYKVLVKLLKEEKRRESNDLFSFYVSNAEEVINPYKSDVDLAFCKHTSPATNSSIANLLDEVGLNMYSSPERMFFELIQNADDAASENGVIINIDKLDNYLVFTHNGFHFSKNDFESIVSAAKSTKTSKEKTGYKGIGFKSVFTNSQQVYVHSGGYHFLFDKNTELYDDFDGFYFKVNKKNTVEEQEDFIRTFQSEKKSFRGVKDIPWQLLPIWYDDVPDSLKKSAFAKNQKVSFALNIKNQKIEDYIKAIEFLFDNPKFILFLRHTNRLDLKFANKTITKDIKDGIVTIKNSFASKRTEELIKRDFEDIPVSNEAFDDKDIDIQIKEITNRQGEKENKFYDNNNQELEDIPDRIASSKTTTISFVANYDNGNISENKGNSLYAYLPMNEHRFRFPFYINADFVLAANRETLLDSPWNYYLLANIGELIVQWVADLADKGERNCLNLLPLQYFDDSTLDVKQLAQSFNSAYRTALESEAFILNHKGELAKQDEIIIDKTGLSEVMGEGQFCDFIETDCCLPSCKIDSGILSQPIFTKIIRIDFQYIEDYWADITFNPFSNWFSRASDIQKELFVSWLVKSKDKFSRIEIFNEIVNDLPLFKFGESFKSCVEIESSEYIITTEHIEPIKGILSKLGFICSNNVFDENHPLYAFVELQDEDDLFNSIKDCDFSELTAEERKTLFFSLADFDGVGEARLKEIALFKNLKGDPKPLGEMVAYRENVPEWLENYVLCKEDNSTELSDYLIAQEDEFESIIQENISDIDTSWADLYKTYKEEWTGQFTRQIIDNYEIDDEILAIIEESDTKTKEYFLNNVKQLELQSTSTYKKDSYEYRVLQLVLSVCNEPSDFSSKIYFDGQCIKDFSVSDDVVCEYTQNGETKKVKMSLAKLLPQYQNQSDSIEKIKGLFESKKDWDKFFVAKPKPLSEVYSELNNLLGIEHSKSSLWDANSGNSFQYLFSVYTRKQVCSKLFGFQIDLKKESLEFVDDSFNWLCDNKISISDSPFTYHLKKYFINKYFDCDYIFENEQLLPVIEQWADTDKKKKYLKDNGVQTEKCNAIQFRKLFLENKPIDFIDKLEDEEINSGIEFVATANGFDRPFVGENQKNVLLSLKDKCKDLSDYWDEEKMEEKSKEWDAKEYNEWIEDCFPRIFIYPGMLPSQLSYDGEIMLNYDDPECDYHYNKQEKKLFVCNVRKIEDILFEVAKKGTSGLDFDDYKELCLEGKVSVSKEDIEKKDKTIKTLEESNRKKDEIIEQYRVKFGELTDEGNPPTKEPQVPESNSIEYIHSNAQNEINQQSGKVIERDGLSRDEQAAAHREAEKVIKNKLEKDGYDCSNWILDEDTNNPFKKWQSVNQVKNIINPQKDTINLVIKSAKGGYIYLSATDFEFLTSNSNNVLMVWDGKNVHSVTAEDIFNKDSNVNLIFDTEYTPKHYYAALSKVFQYIKRTTFAVKNPSYNAYDTIKSFGMDSKTEGVQELFDDNDL